MALQPAMAQQQVLSLESPTNQFQSVRPQGLQNNTVPIRPLYNLPVIPCIATAAAPAYAEGAFVNCSTDLSGNLRTSGGGGGGGGGTSSSFGAAFPSAGTAAGFSDGTNMQGARVHDLDAGGGTEFNAGAAIRCAASGGSTPCLPPTATSADGIANQQATFMHGLSFMYNGVTWDRMVGSTANGLSVNCIVGCSGGSSTPTDAFANPTTAGLSMGFGMMWNGSTWDRVRGTIANGLTVSVSNATLAVTQSGTWNINNISGTISLPTGAATEATLATRLADATFTGRFPTAYTDADAIANQTTTAIHGQAYMYNGTTWDRMRGTIAGGLLVNVSNATVAVTQSGTWNLNNISGTISLPTGAATEATLATRLADATLTNRLPAGSTPADNESNAITTSRLGVYNFVFDGATWDRWTGGVTQVGTWNIGTLTSITNTVTVQGAKTNNNAAPGTNNIGTLPCVATAAAPSYTEGNQVGCSTDLSGNLRTSGGGGSGGTSSNFGAAFPAAGTASGYSDGTNMQGARVHDLDSGGGTEFNIGTSVRCVASGGSTPCLPATATSADAIANQVSTFIHGLGYMYNGTTWDRLRGTTAAGLLVDVSDAFLLDTTLTARFPSGTTPADNESNAVSISRIGSFNYIFDGTTWDRWTGAVSQSGTWNINNISGTISLPTGAATEATLATRLADSTFTGRFTTASLDADAIANETTTSIHGKCYLYNGTTWDRCRGSIASGLLVNVSNATLAVTQSGTWNINNITGTVSLPTGAATEATLATRLADSTFTGRINTLGQKTMANSTPVVIASDQSAIPVTANPAVTSTVANDGQCPSGAANFTVASSNTSRTWLAIWANPANTDDVYVKMGATATTSDARIAPGQAINWVSGRIYQGQIDAIPNSGTQSVCLIELN